MTVRGDVGTADPGRGSVGLGVGLRTAGRVMGIRGDAPSSGSPSAVRSGTSAGTPPLLARAVGRARRRRARRRRASIRATSTASCAPATSRESSMFAPGHRRRVLRLVGQLRRAASTSAARPPSAWCGGPRPRSSSGICDVVVCATVGQPPPPSPRPRPARPARCCTARRAWRGARRRPSSTSPTATWRRTAATRCTPSATTTATAGTSGRGPRSPPTSAPARAPTPTRCSSASRSRSTTCWSRG